MFSFTIQKWNSKRLQHNEMPGEHFIFGIITECYRYFYGAMMPECNFYSQFKLENNGSLQNSTTENI